MNPNRIHYGGEGFNWSQEPCKTSSERCPSNRDRERTVKSGKNVRAHRGWLLILTPMSGNQCTCAQIVNIRIIYRSELRRDVDSFLGRCFGLVGFPLLNGANWPMDQEQR